MTLLVGLLTGVLINVGRMRTAWLTVCLSIVEAVRCRVGSKLVVFLVGVVVCTAHGSKVLFGRELGSGMHVKVGLVTLKALLDAWLGMQN